MCIERLPTILYVLTQSFCLLGCLPFLRYISHFRCSRSLYGALRLHLSSLIFCRIRRVRTPTQTTPKPQDKIHTESERHRDTAQQRNRSLCSRLLARTLCISLRREPIFQPQNLGAVQVCVLGVVVVGWNKR